MILILLFALIGLVEEVTHLFLEELFLLLKLSISESKVK
jgi:hypothetical protein